MRPRLFIAAGLAIEIASIVVTLTSAWSVHRAEEARQLTLFERQVERGMQVARSRLEQYEYALIAGAGLFHASTHVDAEEWRRFVEALDIEHNYPGISGFGFIRRVDHSDIAAYQREVAQQRGLDFAVKVLDREDPGHRFIIEYIEPLAANLPALGLDIGSNDVRQQAARAAMMRGEAATTRIITLVQDQQRKPGFLMLHPVYRGAVEPVYAAERMRKLQGWTYAPFVGEQVMAGIASIAGNGVSFSIYDGERVQERRIYGGLQPDSVLETDRVVEVGGQQWRFVWGSDGSSESGLSTGNDSLWVMVSGLLTSTGLLVVMLLLHRSNTAAIRRADQALKTKDEFLSVMSHEIRTPLHGVIGMSDMLLEHDLSPTTRDVAETIRTSGQTLLLLVNDILDFTKIESGNLELEQVDFNAVGVIRDTLNLFREDAERKHNRLRLCTASEALWVRGDALRLRQITMNLISNAIKFTADGTVDVEIEYHAGTTLAITVSDTGIGMDQATQEALFQPFTQADASISRRFGGTGLGLSIVKRLVEAMDGHIRCTSNEGSGTTFILQVPLPPGNQPDAQSGPVPLMMDLGLHVLLAEDNSINQRVAQAMLKKLGCTTIVVADGNAAIDTALAEDFDLILMDCQMPELDGLEATRRIRSAGLKLPIIAFTANASGVIRSECDDAGMDDYLTKPIRQNDLMQMLVKWSAPRTP